MKRKMLAGTTSVTLGAFVQDSSSTTGAGLAVTHASSGLVFEYRRQGQSSWTSVTPVSATLGTFTSGGVVADGALTGAIEIGIPDAAVASGARFCLVRLRGVANMLPVLIEIELDAVNYQDAAGFGLSRLNDTITSRMASYTQPTGFLAATFPGEVASRTNITAATGVTTSAFSGTAEATILDIQDQATNANNESTVASAIAAKLNTMLVLDGAVYQFTVNALANAPSGGGGGSTDWTADERTAIRDVLGIPSSGSTPTDPTSGILDTIRDAIGVVDGVVDAILVDTDTTIPATLGTVNSKLDAIDDYIDSEVAAVKSVTDKLDTMLVLNGSVYRYTAASLALAPSGGGGGGGDPWATDLVAGGYSGDEAGAILLLVKAKTDLITTETVFVSASSDGQTIKAYYLESRSIDVPMSESLVGKTIEFTCEDAQGATLETVANGSLSRTASNVSVPITTATTAFIGNHYWSIRDITGGIDRVVAQGVLSVSYAASNDA